MFYKRSLEFDKQTEKTPLKVYPYKGWENYDDAENAKSRDFFKSWSSETVDGWMLIWNYNLEIKDVKASSTQTKYTFKSIVVAWIHKIFVR